MDGCRERGDRVDGGSSLGRVHKRFRSSCGASSAYTCAGIGATSANAGTGIGAATQASLEDDGSARNMRRGSSSNDRDSPDPMEATAWKGLQDNNIYNVWNHGYKLEGQGFKCRYCILSNRGGGATRLRDHLAWITGEVRSCPTVPKYVREAMMESRADSKKKKKEKENRKLRLEREIMEGLYRSEGVINIPDDEEEQVQMALRESLKDKNVNRAVERRCGSGGGVRVSLGKRSITTYFDKELANNKIPMQPRIDTALMEGSREIIGKAWAKFFHANDIAGLKADVIILVIYLAMSIFIIVVWKG